MTDDSKKRAGAGKRRASKRPIVLPKLPELPQGDDSPEKFDVFDASKRSEIMSKVRSTKNKSTELRLIQEFKRLGITGWRRHVKIVGKPDFLFRKLRIALFVDGCFWHGHDCRNTKPKDHVDYWRAKIERNQIRDRAVTERLQALGIVSYAFGNVILKGERRTTGKNLRPIVEALERIQSESNL